MTRSCFTTATELMSRERGGLRGQSLALPASSVFANMRRHLKKKKNVSPSHNLPGRVLEWCFVCLCQTRVCLYFWSSLCVRSSPGVKRTRTVFVPERDSSHDALYSKPHRTVEHQRGPPVTLGAGCHWSAAGQPSGPSL